jgi:hypothetical protein
MDLGRAKFIPAASLWLAYAEDNVTAPLMFLTLTWFFYKHRKILIPPLMFLFHPLEGKINSVNTTRIFFSANCNKIYTKKKFGKRLSNFFEMKKKF